jgi:molybdopterin molybdotransferase
VDSPSVDASLKDGYAVQSRDVASADPEHPVRLKVLGLASAGGQNDLSVMPGTTIRVLTGARIPDNADAVLSEEYVTRDGEYVLTRKIAEPGRNILQKGSDVYIGRPLIEKGQRLTPGMVGLLAAAGHSCVPAYKNPSVMIVATGDEVIAPGQLLTEGKLYASNLVMLDAWCKRYNLKSRLLVVKDDEEEITATFLRIITKADAVITSGGAWTGDRDLVVSLLERLGWTQVFHRIRIGPGKAVGFGFLKQKPVFILPGGPPSNLIGFLQIALPGLLKLSGYRHIGLPSAAVILASDLSGRHADWTQYVFGRIENNGKGTFFHPIRASSRLQSMAEAQAVVAVPEGETHLSAGSIVAAQMLM